MEGVKPKLISSFFIIQEGLYKGLGYPPAFHSDGQVGVRV